MWWYSQLLGEEREEETNEVKEEREEHYDGQIIAFESRILDYINEQHYHGLVNSFLVGLIDRNRKVKLIHLLYWRKDNQVFLHVMRMNYSMIVC